MRATRQPVRDRLAETKESSIESYLVTQVKKLGGRALKIQRLRGWPDRLIFVGGQVWLVETKRPKRGRMEPLQAHIGAWLLARGYNYRRINTRTQVDAWVAEVQQG